MPLTTPLIVRLTLLLALALGAGPLFAQEGSTAPSVDAQAPATQNAHKAPLPAGRITGTVFCADTHRPARGAMLIASAVPKSDSSPANPGNPGMARVGMDGTYVVNHLSPGDYTVIAILPGYISPIDELIVSQIDEHSPAATRKLLESYGVVSVTGNEAEHFDITLQRGAAVSGHVLFSDGSPASQVTLDVEDVNAKNSTSKEGAAQAQMASSMVRTMFTHQSTSTDDQGRFRIAGLKPGTYRIAAVASLDNNANMQDPMEGMQLIFGNAADTTALRVYSGNTLHRKAAKTYELRSADEVGGIDITIPLNAYHVIKGTLTAIDGRVINKAEMTLADTADDSLVMTSALNEEGEFSFGTVATGSYILAAKGAMIVTRRDDSDAQIPIGNVPTSITAEFADGSSPVVVKDSDVPDVSLTLTEVPLPPDANKPPEQADPDR